jgi:hypothetical protein
MNLTPILSNGKLKNSTPGPLPDLRKGKEYLQGSHFLPVSFWGNEPPGRFLPWRVEMTDTEVMKGRIHRDAGSPS